MNKIHSKEYLLKQVGIIGILISFVSLAGYCQGQTFQTKHVTVTVNNKGFITSLRSRHTGLEYCPKGRPSALLSLYKDKHYILPRAAKFNKAGNEIQLDFPNGALATIKVEAKQQYLRMQLERLSNRDGIDNIVWGPYSTTISKKIGEIISVVRDDDFAIGMLGLNDNTTSGPPSDGDVGFMYYYIHSPDPAKYPLPPHLKEGQTFKIGGDGRSDIAFYSQPEDYFRMSYGNGAMLEPDYGSSISMHARDRRKEQLIRFPVLPDNLDGGYNSARYQLVAPVDEDVIGSAIAFYACPDSLGLRTIENIVLNEGLPHPEIDGKWVKDPAAYRPDIAWSGPHDSLAAYARQLGIKGVQDEGMGEYYPNPADRWGDMKVGFSNSPSMSVPEFGAIMTKEGIRYGLHTLCEFLQPGNNSDVAPVPSDSLAIMMRTTLVKDLSVNDSVIVVADTSYFNEYGGWEGNHTNVLKIGKELISYNGITTTWPYTFREVQRGLYGSSKASYKAGDTIVKLQPNCYRGFAPDMKLQDVYADYYGQWLVDGGMDYIDFDGLESCMYQGHGQYSFKRFFRNLFNSYRNKGGNYLRVMGSCLYEGNWHYMSVCNVGGGDHMFSPVLNKWGIEGKDMRYVFESNYFPATFGIISYASDWSIYDAENLQAKSIGWNATYMLGLNQQTVENSAEKQNIFTAFRAWENARACNVFTAAHKDRLRDLSAKFHLIQTGERSFLLYPVKETRAALSIGNDSAATVSVHNEFEQQPLQFALKVMEVKQGGAQRLTLILPDGITVAIDKNLEAGQYIICRDGQLYIANRHRRKTEEIGTQRIPLLKKGSSEVSLRAGDRIRLELVISTIGKGEELK